MEWIIFLLCLGASVLGSICGIGGGVILKPALDLLGVMSVSTISFLSGLTVMAMSAISAVRQRKSRLVEMRTGLPLALGSAAGGIAGNALFQIVRGAVGQEQLVGMVQALALAGITLMTLIYSAFFRDRIPSHHVHSTKGCLALGGVMGLMSAFLGIGGGPINLAILYFAFSMDTKKAAANSLYIILFSQTANFVTSLCRRTVPSFSWQYFLIMVAAGILGGILGTNINRRLSATAANRLFLALLAAVFLICIYNALRFSHT